jgi:hypothetical protein
LILALCFSACSGVLTKETLGDSEAQLRHQRGRHPALVMTPGHPNGQIGHAVELKPADQVAVAASCGRSHDAAA